MRAYRLYILLVLMIIFKNGFSQDIFIKSFHDKGLFKVAKLRLKDYGYKFKIKKHDGIYKIIFKNISKIDTINISELILSTGNITLHKAVEKDSALMIFLINKTEKIEKRNSLIKQKNDSLRATSSDDIIFYKTFLNKRDKFVIGGFYETDYEQLNEVLKSIKNDNVLFSSYLSYLSRKYKIYDLIAFEKKPDYCFTSEMFESIDLVMGNERDYATVKIKLKPEYSEKFNKHQKDNYEGKKVGFFIDNKLLYCPIFIGTSSKSISLLLPTNNIAKYTYSVLKTTQKSLVNKASLSYNELPDYYSDNYYPNIDSLNKVGVSIDSLILLSANSILNTPHDDRINKRNDLLNFVTGWVSKKSSYISMQDGLSKKFYSINPIIWGYYLVCLSKSFVVKPNAADIDIKTNAVKLLMNYIFNVAMFEDDTIKNNEFIKEIKLIKSKKKLIKIIKKF